MRLKTILVHIAESADGATTDAEKARALPCADFPARC